MSKKVGSINDEDLIEESSSLTKPMLGKNKNIAGAQGYPEDLIGGSGANNANRRKPYRINRNDESSDEGGSASDSGSDSNTSMSDISSSDGSSIGGSRKKLLNRKGFSKFIMHLRLLLLKNYWLFRRNLKLSLIQILAPVFFCLLIVFFQLKSSSWAAKEVYNTPQNPITAMPKCSGDPDCLTVGYSIIGDPFAAAEEYSYINEVMKNVAQDNKLVFNKDVRLISIGSVELYYEYIKNNPNMTWYGVVWCTTEWPVTANISIPCKYSHEYEHNKH
jgi:hypothetical protein